MGIRGQQAGGATRSKGTDFGPIEYPIWRALEDVAFNRGLTPTRALRLLIPIWSVEIEAEVTHGEAYGLIDHHVELAIAEARCSTVGEVAEFLFLDAVVVARAVRFLNAIGHLDVSANRLAVTELGYRSLREGQRYTVKTKDRRRLYFDGFNSRPLTQRYYDSRVVTLLDTASASAMNDGPKERRFHRVHGSRGFDLEVVARLVESPDREHFNLPRRIEHPRAIGVAETVWLPVYVVRAVDPIAGPQFLPYSQVDSSADDDLTPIVRDSGIADLLSTESEFARIGDEERVAKKWLTSRGLGEHELVRGPFDTWQVDLPARVFGQEGPLSLARAFVPLPSSTAGMARAG